MKKGLYLVAVIFLLVGCQEVDQMKEDIQGTYKDLEQKVGETVSTFEAVNSVVTTEAKEVIDLIKQLDLTIKLQRDGISFTKAEELEGMIGINQNRLFLQMKANTNNADTVEKFIQVVNVFSEENNVEQKIDQMVSEQKTQRINLGNGFLESDGQEIEIYIEGSMLPQQ